MAPISQNITSDPRARRADVGSELASRARRSVDGTVLWKLEAAPGQAPGDVPRPTFNSHRRSTRRSLEARPLGKVSERTISDDLASST